jgi:cell division protein FtsN
VLVWQNYREKEAERTAPDTPRPEPRAAAAATDSEDATRNYDFYDMLPTFEVVVPERDRDVSRDALPAAIERPGVYVLQAGSYRRQEDADRVQAQLKIQGIEANVQRVAVDDDVWHRVRIGPITDLTELNRLRARLKAAEFDDALVIRVGD